MTRLSRLAMTSPLTATACGLYSWSAQPLRSQAYAPDVVEAAIAACDNLKADIEAHAPRSGETTSIHLKADRFWCLDSIHVSQDQSIVLIGEDHSPSHWTSMALLDNGQRSEQHAVALFVNHGYLELEKIKFVRPSSREGSTSTRSEGDKQPIVFNQGSLSLRDCAFQGLGGGLESHQSPQGIAVHSEAHEGASVIVRGSSFCDIDPSSVAIYADGGETLSVEESRFVIAGEGPRAVSEFPNSTGAGEYLAEGMIFVGQDAGVSLRDSHVSFAAAYKTYGSDFANEMLGMRDDGRGSAGEKELDRPLGVYDELDISLWGSNDPYFDDDGTSEGTGCNGNDEAINITSCSQLRTKIHANEGCVYVLRNDVTCNATMTVADSQSIVVLGYSDENGFAFPTLSSNDSFNEGTEMSSDDWSIFVVAEGAQLELQGLAFSVTPPSGNGIRVAHNLGNLYMAHCTTDGRGQRGDDIVVVSYGGAIFSENANSIVALNNVTFMHMTSIYGGGAVYVEGDGTNVTITDCIFYYNSVTASGTQKGVGGALYTARGTYVNVTASTFENNYAAQAGGMYCCGGRVADSVFIGGDAGATSYTSGGLVSNGPTGGDVCEHPLVVTGCEFSNHFAAESNDGTAIGSALTMYDSDLHMRDNIFHDNTDTAVYIESSGLGSRDTILIESCFFVNNTDPALDFDEMEIIEQGTALVMKNTADVDENQHVGAWDVQCSNNSPSHCEMIFDVANASFSTNSSCHVCDIDGETIYASGPVDSQYKARMGYINGTSTTKVDNCDALKARVEVGENMTFIVLNDITCTETMRVVSGQSVVVQGDTTSSESNASAVIGRPFNNDTSSDVRSSTSTNTESSTTGGISTRRFSTSSSSYNADDDEAREDEVSLSGGNLFYVERGGSLTLSDMTFRGGDTSDGGHLNGVRVVYNAGDLTLNRCMFSEISTHNGDGDRDQVVDGGVVASQSDGGLISIRSCSFVDNVVTSHGGAIFANGEDERLEINVTTFTGNSAGHLSGKGGAIYALSTVHVTAESNSFVKNEAYSGAAMEVCGAHLVDNHIRNCTTFDETSGAIACNSQSSNKCSQNLVVSSSEFTENMGISIAAYQIHVTINGSNFTGNQGTSVLFKTNDDTAKTSIVLEDVIFSDNNGPGAYNFSHELGIGQSSADPEVSTNVTGGVAIIMVNDDNSSEPLTTMTSNGVTCEDNKPGQCEVVLGGFELVFQSFDCNTCDESANNVSSADNYDANEDHAVQSSENDSGSSALLNQDEIIGVSVAAGVILVAICAVMACMTRRRYAEKSQLGQSWRVATRSSSRPPRVQTDTTVTADDCDHRITDGEETSSEDKWTSGGSDDSSVSETYSPAISVAVQSAFRTTTGYRDREGAVYSHRGRRAPRYTAGSDPPSNASNGYVADVDSIVESVPSEFTLDEEKDEEPPPAFAGRRHRSEVLESVQEAGESSLSDKTDEKSDSGYPSARKGEMRRVFSWRDSNSELRSRSDYDESRLSPAYDEPSRLVPTPSDINDFSSAITTPGSYRRTSSRENSSSSSLEEKMPVFNPLRKFFGSSGSFADDKCTPRSATQGSIPEYDSEMTLSAISSISSSMDDRDFNASISHTNTRTRSRRALVASPIVGSDLAAPFRTQVDGSSNSRDLDKVEAVDVSEHSATQEDVETRRTPTFIDEVMTWFGTPRKEDSGS